MKVRIPDLGEESQKLDFAETADAPGAAAALEVRADIYRMGQDVHFSGHIAGGVVSTCPRCLDEFSQPLERNFAFLLRREDAGGHIEADQGIDSYNGEELDLSPLVREQALLALDSSALCSAACKGLCAGCGTNLNHEACSCGRRGA